jgi:YidC/Oxa1 family membrane protein insertase
VDIYSFGPVATVLNSAYSFVMLLSGTLTPVFGAASAVAAVVLLTLLVRAALIPVGVSQVRAEYTRKRLAPQLAELQRLYGHDRAKLQAKMMELYASEKASPLAGCLPLLAQAPVISIVYALFLHTQIAGHANSLLAGALGGVALGTSLIGQVGAAGAWPGVLVFVIVLGMITAVALVSRRVLRQPVAAVGSSGRSVSGANGLARALSFTPLITVIFAAFVPLAAAVYLLTTTAWTVAERVALRRLLDPGRQGDTGIALR